MPPIRTRRHRCHTSTSQPPTSDIVDLEKQIQAACEATSTGAARNLKAACRDLGIIKHHYTALRRYKGKAVPCREAHIQQQHLNQAQEEVLLEWIQFLGNTGRPLCKQTIAPYVFDMCNKYPSEKPSTIDPMLAQAFNQPVVQDFFKQFEAVIKEHNIPWENIYNMDEKGIQLGGGQNSNGRRFFFSHFDHQNYTIHGGSLELVTVIECVSAVGANILPGFIFAGTIIDAESYEVHPEIFLTTSINGWTNDFLCTEWFRKSFIPQSRAQNKSGKPTLLVYNGHGSHLMTTMIDLAIENQIHLLCLPPHTTHRLQPLDVGVFGPLQKAWYRRAEPYTAKYGTSIARQHVVKEPGANVASTPPNLNVFTAADYAPSVSTSTVNHAPASYPENFPDGWIDGPSSDDPDYVSDDDDRTILCEPTIVGRIDRSEHDSDGASSEGTGDPDGSETSLSDGEVELDNGGGNSNSNNGNSSSNNNSIGQPSRGVRAWLQVSQGALPLGDISAEPSVSQRTRSQSWSLSSWIPTPLPSPANSRSTTPAAMSIHLQPTQLLLMMSKKALVTLEKISK
ncbi:hypothetical protein SERLA73DRAFT_152834 [Serpula lacrymans var. lacrymans S7.3]|uniref:DDE-1 domain-containing protein n=1 Tax=Serpula lacrymans var. lacrymans (strain S7.3) TaxID=936435 RepID=F8PZ35_SERL3|nr:hypothetical protein SERLA73DRAFT_152834 [Serpula lacrymans var. lacrymans S7.3]